MSQALALSRARVRLFAARGGFDLEPDFKPGRQAARDTRGGFFMPSALITRPVPLFPARRRGACGRVGWRGLSRRMTKQTTRRVARAARRLTTGRTRLCRLPLPSRAHRHMLRRTGVTGLTHAIDPARIAIFVVRAKALGSARILEHLHRRSGSFATRPMAASRVRVSPFETLPCGGSSR